MESLFVRLETMLDRCMVCVECTIGLEIVLDAPDGTIVDGAQVEARFGPFGDIANTNIRQVHGLRKTYHRLGNRFGRNRWIS